MLWNAIVRELSLAAAMAVLLGTSSARAQTELASCEYEEGGSGSWIFDAEALFLQLGNSVGTEDANVFGLEISQRLTLTYLHETNVGFRTTWFYWDHEATDPAVGDLALSASNLDFEVFKRLDFVSRTFLEMGGGLRYTDATHNYDNDPNDFTGIGGLLSIHGGIRVFDNGTIYSRGKFSVLMGDGAHDSDDEDLNLANEVVRSQTEIGFGYEHSICVGNVVLLPRVGLEWQIWDGFGIDPEHHHPDTDLGFFGLVTGVAVAY